MKHVMASEELHSTHAALDSLKAEHDRVKLEQRQTRDTLAATEREVSQAGRAR